jgi:uncharacterized membrane protein
MGRLLALSDGVFAFSLTFLVVGLILPRAGSTGLPSLSGYLGALEPQFVAYLLSFFIIGSWWMSHHRIFSPIVRYDALLVRLNNLFLLVISVTPFLVGVLFDYGPGSTGVSLASSRLAVIIYSLAQAGGGGILLGIWRHSTRGRRLVVDDLPSEWIRTTELRQVAVVAIFLVAIPVVFVYPLAAELVWILAIVGVGRLARRAHPPPKAEPSAGDGPALG